jgi:hypothetical protein
MKGFIPIDMPVVISIRISAIGSRPGSDIVGLPGS